MGVLGRPNKIKAPAPVIRIEKVPVPSKPKSKTRPLPHQSGGSGPGASSSSPAARNSGGGGGSTSRGASSSASRTPSVVARRRGAGSASPYPSSSTTTDEVSSTNRRKRRAPSSRSAASETVKFSSDDDSGSEHGGAWEDSLGARHKRRKRDGAGRPVDLGRRLRHPALWAGEEKGEEEEEEEDGGEGRAMIHAADVASLELKCEPTLGVAAQDVALELRYPGSRHPERYAANPTLSCNICAARISLTRTPTEIDTSLCGEKIRSTLLRISQRSLIS